MFHRKYFIAIHMSFFEIFPFQVKTDDPDLPEENQASEVYQAIAYSSLSQSYLYIDWTGNYKPMLVGEYLNIIVTPRSPYINKITHYNYLVSTVMTDLQLSLPPPGTFLSAYRGTLE